ncbi:MAG: membrane dipeptidase [Gemmatimonadaceae bacterium]
MISIRTTLMIGPPPVWGVADLHIHQFAKLGFGGRSFFNVPGNDVSEAGLKRAVDGGLRLMTMLVVNTEAYCLVRAPNAPCTDEEAITAQLNAATAFEQRIDAVNGGQGKGWYRIVKNPAEARAAIAKNQLAVVLGVEVDSPLGCREIGHPLNNLKLQVVMNVPAIQPCTPADIQQRLDALFAKGVRQLNPIHLANNGFGGYALYDDKLILNNLFLNDGLPAMRDCSGHQYDYQFRPKAVIVDAIAPIVSALIQPVKNNPGDCNAKGLTPLGEFVVARLMAEHMIIDIDHMSELSAAGALVIADRAGYPLMTSHSGLFEASQRGQDKVAEGQRRPEELDAIRDRGGIAAIILHQGKTSEIPSFPGSSVPNDCGGSPKTFAQVYQFALQRMRGPVAIGTDLNAADGYVGPRFGSKACGGNDVEAKAQSLGSQVTYPLPVFLSTGWTAGTLPVSVQLPNYNTSGYAEVGLFPEFLRDLHNSGLADDKMTMLFRSAEAYIEMWERIEARGPAQ